MSDLAAYLAAAALLTFSAYRLRTDRHGAPPYQVQHYGYCLMMCLGLAMAILAPATPRLLADVGLSRVAEILLGDSVRIAAVSVLMFMAYVVARRPVRGLPVVAAVVAQVACIGCFVAARPVISGPDDSLVTHGSGRWLLAGDDLVFAGYTGWTLAIATAAFWREARRAGPGPVRTGIRLSLVALAVGMVWTAWTFDDIVHVLRTGVQDGSEDLVSNALGALCAAFIVAATLVAKWHTAYAVVRERVHTYLVYRRLTPLWEAVRDELPEIALDDRHRVLFGGRSLDFALYRRVIEIHDARLALRPYAPEQVAEAAGDEAHIEAASLAAALANHRDGRLRTSGEPVRHTEAAKTVAAEAAWLAEVANAFRHMGKDSRHASAAPATLAYSGEDGS
ncbi:hypothetical protein ABH935_001760 [Catenulispora sp. GAS73]|uniref:MAB_1171c family putative transporter n=1 Tax=Catenulispora sp. GAS73 TaxID=3156269 RepID=UPI0035195201